MSDLTDYARNLLARTICGRAPAQPGAVYAALGTGGSAAAGLAGEPAGGGYARQRVTFTGSGAQRNAEAIRFAFSGIAGTLTHVALYDAASGGNALLVSPLDAPVAMTGAGTVTVAAGSLLVNPG
ncbi:hypothetical protein J8J14_18310 [Roseomonas sp. SSH11]|uniref:Uncharacterized protein n=1 Tax=Pararoseomonas baculiformis TaxID=2820812 RepID=A0ABS4AI63_9PROT|nr:hypothetical protein [Pararoseomonas baculiformis]MBP0446732.1 hypothetical protein [Pararoseomonas baculiformis]